MDKAKDYIPVITRNDPSEHLVTGDPATGNFTVSNIRKTVGKTKFRMTVNVTPHPDPERALNLLAQFVFKEIVDQL